MRDSRTRRPLAQPNSEMFERNIGHLASNEKEVLVRVYYEDESYVGFIAGLDDEYLQLCLSEANQSLVLIDRMSITSLKETGNTLYDYEMDPNFDEEVVERIRERCKHFVRVAYSFNKKGEGERASGEVSQLRS